MRDAAQSEHRDANFRRPLGKALKTEGRLRLGFRWGEEDRTQHHKIGAALFGFDQLALGVAGDPNEELRRRYGADAIRRERASRQMHAAGPATDGDVEARIDEDAAAMRIGKRQDTFHQRGQFTGGQIFLADLHEIDAVHEAAGDGFDEGFHATSQFTVSNVVPDHERATGS